MTRPRISLLLCSLVVFSAAACAKEPSDKAQSNPGQAASSQVGIDQASSTDKSAAGSSADATGLSSASIVSQSLNGSEPTGNFLPDGLGTSAEGHESVRQLQADFKAKNGYRSWKSNQRHVLSSLASHGQSYFNDILKTSMDKKSVEHPVGSVSVLELYANATDAEPNGWAVLARLSDAPNGDGWYTFLVERKSKDAAFGEPKVNTHAESSCVSCHIGTRAFIVPVNLDSKRAS